MTTKLMMILAAACLALAGCNDSEGVASIAGPAEVEPVEPAPEPVAGPLGLTFETDVAVMSADHQAENTVSVAGDGAKVALNNLTFDDESGEVTAISITLVLPDGSELTLDDETTDINFGFDTGIGNGTVLVAEFETEDEHKVQAAIGLGLQTEEGDTQAEMLDDALFLVARVNLAEEEDDPDQGYNTYLVTGNETDTLPRGSADYSGALVATTYQDGSLIGDSFGSVYVGANFETSEVEINLSAYSGSGLQFNLEGENIPIDGSRYSGLIDGSADYGNVRMVGDVIGAFFGDNAEATAGVFGATETAAEEANGADVEIVGGFAAYANTGD